MLDSFVECRALGHAWESFTPIDRPSHLFRNVLSLRCVRCGTERHDAIDLSGDVTSRRYRHPEGYRLTGDEKPSRSFFRRQVFLASRRKKKKAS